MLAFSIFITIYALVLTFILVRSYFQKHRFQDDQKTLAHGFKIALKTIGFRFNGNPRYDVELYRWVVVDPQTAYPECERRAQLEPKDIADWMRIGLPQTPESKIPCSKKDTCSCQLILTQIRKPSNAPKKQLRTHSK